VIVLDVRWPEIYDQGHIPGALNFPLDDFEEQKKALLSKITLKDEILVYCAGVTCHDSHTFAVRLVEMGFTHVTVYAGGFAEWQEMGFDVATQGADQ
jgi:rhodanese-related sulfurtransferase